MPSLLHHPFPNLIRTLPVESHSIEVNADFWKPKFHGAGKSALWMDIFGRMPNINITRGRLLTFAYPSLEQKCAEVLLWGYPTNQRGRVSDLLPVIGSLSCHAGSTAHWPGYFTAFKVCGSPIGISTITKFAYFFRCSFGGNAALILDKRLIDNTVNWSEVSLPGLSYYTGPSLYLNYLEVMHSASRRIACAGDQLEFFIFTMGKCFDP